MIDLDKVQSRVLEVYREYFGYTPLAKRANMIIDEAIEIRNAIPQGVPQLKEEMGDLLSCLLAGIAEQGFDASRLLAENLGKIQRRSNQYKKLGRKTQVLILGGAFDPIHIGHIQLAQFALDVTRIFDELWLMPCFNHMLGKRMTDYQHRLDMCQHAAEADARIKVSSFEGDKKLAGETYQMVQWLFNTPEYSDNNRFSLLVGMDNGNQFDKWVNFDELRNIIPFVVVSRMGVDRDSKVDWYLKEPHRFLETESKIMEVSSSHIREQISAGTRLETILGLDPRVAEYISGHDLYGLDKSPE